MKDLGSVKFGEVTIKVLANSNDLTVAELHFPAGVAADVHQHVNEEVNYVVKGVFETLHQGEVLFLNPGDSIQVSSNLEHNLRCVSHTDGIIITAWTPSRKDIMDKIS